MRRLAAIGADLWLVPPLLVVLAIACRRERADPYDPAGSGVIGPELSDAQGVMLGSSWAIIALLAASLGITGIFRAGLVRRRLAAWTVLLAALIAVVAGFWPERERYPDPARYRAPPLLLSAFD